MSVRVEETETGRDIVFEGWADGIARSPHKGIGNMQNVNIATEVDEIMCSFARFLQSQINSTGSHTLTANEDGGGINLSTSLGASMTPGVWINVFDSGITGLSDGIYYVTQKSSGLIQLSETYGGDVVTFTPPGTASFEFLINVDKPIAKATERYSDGTTFQYRYYILDIQGHLWVFDSGVTTPGVAWFLPDTDNSITNGTGLAVLNGWVMVFSGHDIFCKATVALGPTPGWQSFASGVMLSPSNSPNPHFAFVGHQGKCYYTDGPFIGSIFPNISLLTITTPNIQSYAQYTASSDTGQVAPLISGSLPLTTPSATIPAVFFSTGTMPSALTPGVIYWILYAPGLETFQVFDDQIMSNPALDIDSGSLGDQFFNTYYPVSSDGAQAVTFTQQRLNLPAFEIAQCMAEVGNQVIIGAKGNVLYPWNQVDSLPGDLIPMPENNAVKMITVNNMAYILAGNKGNVYITNGSTASLAISVPDYCAGIPGNPASYIEPYFIWLDVMYLRGRVYFSIQDQTSSKAGNCGGIWSFVPTQNFFVGQDTGLSLRLENRNSYGSYNGGASILLPSENQLGMGPQYWAGWFSGLTSVTYGIDFTDTIPVQNAIIETDLAPVGTMLDKASYKQIEYKLASPLQSGESIALEWRKNATDAYTSLGTVIPDGTSAVGTLSGYFKANFQNLQWIQFRVTLTSNSLSSSSFVRLKELRLR